MKKIEVLKQAKEIFLERKNIGMCYAITLVHWKYHKSMYPRFSENLPEFNREFLNPNSNPDNPYWWDRNDVESRITAFDRLIEIYKNSNEEWIG